MERRSFLLSTLQTTLFASAVGASPIDPKQNFVQQSGDIKFAPWDGLPSGSGEMAKLYGPRQQAVMSSEPHGHSIMTACRAISRRRR